MNLQPDGENNLTFRFPTVLHILLSQLSIAIEKWKLSSKIIITCRDILTKFSCILLCMVYFTNFIHFLKGQRAVTGTRKDFN